ncbi:Uncharacterised protein [Chlamydia trachomatis]|nr:Uncharacterised protein [Chlamydia trachomatis]
MNANMKVGPFASFQFIDYGLQVEFFIMSITARLATGIPMPAVVINDRIEAPLKKNVHVLNRIDFVLRHTMRNDHPLFGVMRFDKQAFQGISGW